MFEFAVLNPDNHELAEIIGLYSEYLNYGSGIYPHLVKVFSAPDTISFKAIDKRGRIAGIAIYTKGIEFSCGHLDLCRKIADLVDDELVYTGEGLVVTNEARHNQIHFRLNELVRGEILKRAASLGKRAFTVHELWVHPDGKIPALRVINDVFGITKDLGTFKNFYKDFHHFGYLCKICNGLCKCSARIILSELLPEVKASEK